MLTKQRADRVLLSNISWQQFENILHQRSVVPL